MKRRKPKKFVKVIFVLIILGILGYLGYIGIKNFFPQKKEVGEVQVVQVTNSIDEYGYTLEDRDTELFKTNFEELKELLNQEDYDQEEYLKLISKLFIIDLYTINNKLSRYDVGGLEYVYSGAVTSFKSVAQNSIYKTVENNIDGTRKQELPEVESIEVTDVSEYSFEMPDESKEDGYRVKLSWTYKEKMGYDNSATIVLIKDGNKYGVVYFNSWEFYYSLV